MMDIVFWVVEIAMIGGILVIELIEFKKQYMTKKVGQNNAALAS